MAEEVPPSLPDPAAPLHDLLAEEPLQVDVRTRHELVNVEHG